MNYALKEGLTLSLPSMYKVKNGNILPNPSTNENGKQTKLIWDLQLGFISYFGGKSYSKTEQKNQATGNLWGTTRDASHLHTT